MHTYTLIYMILENFTLTCFLLALIATLIALPFCPKPLTRVIVSGTLLSTYIFFTVGIANLYNFIMHVFFGGFTAHFINWAQSPFQEEVGFASLGFAMVGFYAFRQHFSARLCAILGPAVFLWGAAIGHIYQILTTGNLAPGNAGLVYYSDLLQPILGFLILLWHDKCKTHSLIG